MSVDTEQMTEDRTSGVDSLGRAGNASSDERPKNKETCKPNGQKNNDRRKTEGLDP